MNLRGWESWHLRGFFNALLLFDLECLIWEHTSDNFLIIHLCVPLFFSKVFIQVRSAIVDIYLVANKIEHARETEHIDETNWKL